MNPRLIAITGPLRGSAFDLTEEFSFGRDASSSACLNDTLVSRRHSVISKEGSQFKILDLQSKNGTMVNGIPIKERVLQNEDRIGIGDSTFLFLTAEDEISTSGEAQFEDQDFVGRSTTRLKIEDAVYLNPENLLKAGPLTERILRGLGVFLRLSQVIHTIQELDEFQKKLMESILEILPAQEGAILLLNTNNEVVSTYGYDRMIGRLKHIRVSRTIVEQVIHHRESILSNNILESGALNMAESLRDLRITSVLAVPLLLFGKLFGIFYFDSSDPGVFFDEDHLHLMTAIAGVAGIALENVRRIESLRDENRRLQDEILVEHNMIGESPVMQDVYQRIARVAPTDSTVLIVGESGTGKELVAQSIHKSSSRVSKPFVIVNCAALTETLLESELFGHEKGAFTGAIAQKKGKLEVADGGTVFLDEIGELNLTLQSKLLRVLQQREFERVGGTKPIHIDVRFIAATNRNLQEAVQAGTFRQDLFYRLNVVNLTLPRLRDRREDIPLLATYFVAKYSNKIKRRVVGVSNEARELLLQYDWPGNIRELENAIERAVVLGASDSILPDDLPESILEASPPNVPNRNFHEAVNEAKREIVKRAIQQAGNYSDAARLLGMHPNNFHRLVRSLKLKE